MAERIRNEANQLRGSYRVSIVILNWNNWTDTVECLDSLSRISYSSYNIIVVDNGSKDDSLKSIAKYCWENSEKATSVTYNDACFNTNSYYKGKMFSKFGSKSMHASEQNGNITFIINDQNSGFAKGCNIGISYAQKNFDPKYILLLNNDTLVEPNFLDILVTIAESDPKIGALGPDIRLYSNKEIAQINKYSHFRTSKEVDALSGAALLVKEKVFERVGLFDEVYYIYSEDRDFCERIREAGYKVIYVPEALVYHKLESSTRSFPGFRAYYMVRNDFLIIRRYEKGIKLLTYLVQESQITNFFKIIVLRRSRKLIPYFFRGLIDGISLFIANPSKQMTVKMNKT
jgi:GT2 family glycosyltransferase